jgi:hypothetical protein
MGPSRPLRNPWLGLGWSRPFVLPEDEPYIRELNRFRHRNEYHRIELNLPPTPFIGSTVAPVVILLANPGIGDGDRREQTSRVALEQIFAGFQKGRSAPFWPLLEDFADTNAGRWWTSKTRDLAIEVGGRLELARKLQAIELHGYHSKKWAAPLVNFPSQGYGFELVRRAIERDALIIIGRAQSYWYSAVPELRRYPLHIQSLVSSRSAYLSRGNLGRNYRKVIRALHA